MQWFIFVWEWVNIYIYTPLCKPGRERRWPCACAIHLQPGRGGVCVSSPLCSDCCVRLLRDWPPVSAFGRERGSRQHPLLVEHSRPNCRVIRAFESPNTTKVSKNTSKSRWICRFWQQQKKVARRMICLCYNQCLKWGKKVAVLSLHWQIITFLQWKTKLGDIAVTTIYCYLFINNINVFKHVCGCVRVCISQKTKGKL